MAEEMLSVGIDIGTATTQLVFSKLKIENLASSFSVPRIEIVEKIVFFRSDIIFTPLIEGNVINAAQIEAFVEREYEKTGVDKREIQTGAVIITGETARKENANEVLQTLSGYAGDFVVATAGPDLESIIAGKGAGVHIYSKENSTSIVNLDIGGGTTNLALFVRGEVKDTGCLDIGGRLIKVDPYSKKIIYIAPKIMELIEEKQCEIRLGMVATKEILQPIINEMVRLLEESVGIHRQTNLYQKILTHKGLKLDEPISCISFTGGVADSIYDTSETDYFKYGDIGILLGQSIAASSLVSAFKLFHPQETIRATVVGAGSHTTEISGSTITYTDNAFPLKNIPILKLSLEDESKGNLEFGEIIEEKINWFRVENDLQTLAIAIHGKKSPRFDEVNQLAMSLLKGMKELIKQEHPLIIIVENDMAKVLGQTLYARLEYQKNLICIDGIHVENGDYIDIGKPIAEGRVLPVVIKTLVFN